MSPPRPDLGDDLGYVRGVVAGAAPGAGPRAIWFLWGGVALVGFSLIDLAPRAVAAFWAVAAPVGFALSIWLGRRDARASGQESRSEARAHLLHWGALTVACFLLLPLAATGGLAPRALPAAVLLVVALGYFLAGVHLAPPLLWVGGLVAAGYLAVLVVPGPVWIAVGVLLCVALVLGGLAVERPGGRR